MGYSAQANLAGPCILGEGEPVGAYFGASQSPGRFFPRVSIGKEKPRQCATGLRVQTAGGWWSERPSALVIRPRRSKLATLIGDGRLASQAEKDPAGDGGAEFKAGSGG